MPEPSDYEALLVQHLPFIRRFASSLTRRDALSDDDAQDFISWATAKLVDDDYAILRKFRGESSLTTYLSMVLARMYGDFRTSRFGRWQPSAAAKRLGTTAILLERLILKDKHSVDEAIEVLRSRSDANVSERDIREIIKQLPLEPIGKPAYVPATALEYIASNVETDSGVLEFEDARHAETIRRALDNALSELPDEDRTILKLRFIEQLTIADIARILGLPQKPLYRRVNKLLETLRKNLEAAGFSRELIAERLKEVSAGTPNQSLAPPELELDGLNAVENDVSFGAPQVEPSLVSVIADLDTVPPEVVTELMAALDELHRAHGGGGLRILRAYTGSAVREGVPA